MNIFNRVVVTLGLFLTMVLSACVFVLSEPVVDALLIFLQNVKANLAAMSGLRALGRLGGGLLITLVIWAICAALLYLEFRRAKAVTIKVQKVSGGDAEVTADSIGGRLEYNIDLLQDVVRVKAAIANSRRGIKVLLEVETSPEIDVPTKTDEIQTLARDIVENRMGLRLDSVRVVLRHTPYPKKGILGGRRPAPMTTPATGTPEPSTPVAEPAQVLPSSDYPVAEQPETTMDTLWTEGDAFPDESQE